MLRQPYETRVGRTLNRSHLFSPMPQSRQTRCKEHLRQMRILCGLWWYLGSALFLPVIVWKRKNGCVWSSTNESNNWLIVFRGRMRPSNLPDDKKLFEPYLPYHLHDTRVWSSPCEAPIGYEPVHNEPGPITTSVYMSIREQRTVEPISYVKIKPQNHENVGRWHGSNEHTVFVCLMFEGGRASCSDGQREIMKNAPKGRDR